MLANDLSAEAHSLRAIRAFQRHFHIIDRNDVVSFYSQRAANRMANRKNFADAASPKFVGTAAEEIFNRRANENGAAVGVEEEQSVLQAAHDLVKVLAQGAEDFAPLAQFFSDADDFRAYPAEFIPALHWFHIEFARRDTIQLGRNAVDRRK